MPALPAATWAAQGTAASSHPSLSLAASKLLQAGKTRLTSHSLKAAGRLAYFLPSPPSLFQLRSEGGFSPFPSIPGRRVGGYLFGKGSEQV